MKKITAILLLIWLGLMLSACSKETYYRYDFNLGNAFQTVSTVTLVSTEITTEEYHRLEEEMIAILERLDNVFNVVDRNDGNTTLLMEVNNQAGIAPVVVTDEVLYVVELAIEGSIRSKVDDVALFDVTISPLWNAWDFINQYYEETMEYGVIPSQETIDSLLLLVNYEKIHINRDDKTLFLEDPNMMIDLGGVVKGYAADVLKEYLIDEGYQKAIIDVGRNIVLLGSFLDLKLEDAPWKVSIQRPYAKWWDGENKQTVGSMYLVDQTIVSSGVYEKYIKLENQEEYHHILDPRTGYPFVNNVVSVTVVTSMSVWADILSTMLLAFGLERGLEFVNSTDDVECIYIIRVEDGYEIVVSEGLKDNFVFNENIREFNYEYKG